MAANPVPISPRPFTIHHLTSGDGAALLKCEGRLNGESGEQLKAEVKKLLPGNKRFLVDLSDVTYMDSSGLGALLAAYVSVRTSGCQLKLINLSERISELLRLTKLASVFEGYGEYL